MVKVYACPHCGQSLNWNGVGFHADAGTGQRHHCPAGTRPGTAYRKTHKKTKSKSLPRVSHREGKTITGEHYFACPHEHSGPPWEREGCECEFDLWTEVNMWADPNLDIRYVLLNT